MFQVNLQMCLCTNRKKATIKITGIDLKLFTCLHNMQLNSGEKCAFYSCKM